MYADENDDKYAHKHGEHFFWNLNAIEMKMKAHHYWSLSALVNGIIRGETAFIHSCCWWDVFLTLSFFLSLLRWFDINSIQAEKSKPLNLIIV